MKDSSLLFSAKERGDNSITVSAGILPKKNAKCVKNHPEQARGEPRIGTNCQQQLNHWLLQAPQALEDAGFKIKLWRTRT